MKKDRDEERNDVVISSTTTDLCLTTMTILSFFFFRTYFFILSIAKQSASAIDASWCRGMKRPQGICERATGLRNPSINTFLFCRIKSIRPPRCIVCYFIYSGNLYNVHSLLQWRLTVRVHSAALEQKNSSSTQRVTISTCDKKKREEKSRVGLMKTLLSAKLIRDAIFKQLVGLHSWGGRGKFLQHNASWYML